MLERIGATPYFLSQILSPISSSPMNNSLMWMHLSIELKQQLMKSYL